MKLVSIPRPAAIFLAASVGVLTLAVMSNAADQVATTPTTSAAAVYEVKTPTMSVRLSADGAIVGVVFGDGKIERAVNGHTELAGCHVQGKVVAKKLAGGGVEFARTLTSKEQQRTCTLTDRFLPTPDSVRWEIEIQSADEPWTTPIVTALHWPTTTESRFWTTWGDPDDRHDAWQDPLVWRPLVDRSWGYQIASYTEMKKATSVICIPIVSVAEPKDDAAVSLVLSPEDTRLNLDLTTTNDGTISYSRSYHRLGNGRRVGFAMDLVAHPADCRAALGWMVCRYPEFFNPPNPAADQMAGCGAYSGNEEHFDVEKLRRMAFRVNWKCSEDFPYMGMFLPPMKDAQERWDRSPDETTPGKPAWTSYQTMNDYSRWMRANGFYILNYFNVTEYGHNMKFPPPPRKATDDAALWRDPHDYLYQSDRRSAVLMNGSVPFESNCYGAIIVDPGDPAYQRHLLEQARRHIERMPDSHGICIDRTDWLGCYNVNADDGVSWVDGRPARSLFESWNGLMAKLGPEMHKAGKVIFINDCIPRLEMLRQVDGIYAEWTWEGMDAYWNYSALLGLRKPVMAWTPDDTFDKKKEKPDDYLQRCLYLGVYPTAPYPLNNHCLRPSEVADAAYLDYGPLLDAMRGKKWVLEPHCVEVQDDAAKANLFETPQGYAIPVAFGGEAEIAKVVLRGLKGISDNTRVEALHPGVEKSISVVVERSGDTFVLTVPLHRGCAMVRVAKDADGT